LPRIIGGIDSLQSRLHYPVEALQSHIEGNIYIVVTIDSSGVPLNPKILKGLGYGCEEEATRLVNTSKFLPATKNGKPVKCQIIIPIKFRLPKRTN
jgi:TonB family protein